MSGAQWIRLDAHLTSSPLAGRLKREFGAAGLMAWVALLAACKRAPVSGQITFNSESEALTILGLSDVALIDNDGKEWPLESFWRVLGHYKQTKRTARGQLVNVRCTHWEQWQKDERREDARERQRRTRAIKGCDEDVTPPRHVTKNVTPDIDIDRDKDKDPPKPPEGGADVAPLRQPQPGPVAPPVGLRAALADAVPTAADNRTNGRRSRATTEPAVGAEP